jgi:hypothetical protein
MKGEDVTYENAVPAGRTASRPPWARPVLFAAALTSGVAFGAVAPGAPAAPAPPEPFKVTNIHFETNSSACDMGIQIGFDTEGIITGVVRDPHGRAVYSFQSAGGMRATGGQTEGFLEAVEPQITELLEALGCELSDEEGQSSLEDLFRAFPAGDYTFTGRTKEASLEGVATLTHHIPAGPEIVAPEKGKVVPDNAGLLIDWDPVTNAILPELGPVDIVGYHVVVYEAGGEVTPQLDVDLPSSQTSVTVPEEFLKPSTTYQFEVLATEQSGNQTITEGFFCTTGIAEKDCVAPE